MDWRQAVSAEVIERRALGRFPSHSPMPKERAASGRGRKRFHAVSLPHGRTPSCRSGIFLPPRASSPCAGKSSCVENAPAAPTHEAFQRIAIGRLALALRFRAPSPPGETFPRGETHPITPATELFPCTTQSPSRASSPPGETSPRSETQHPPLSQPNRFRTQRSSRPAHTLRPEKPSPRSETHARHSHAQSAQYSPSWPLRFIAVDRFP